MILTLVDEIKARFTLEDALRIVNIEGLRQSGGRFVGHCPFHSDKTPSWSGRIKDGRWYCFGCNLRGDQIDLVARYLNLDTGDAIKMLTDHLGISKDVTPETKAATRKAILKKQQERAQKELDAAKIREQYKRLCCLERSVHKVLSSIQTEQDLDRPDVVAAFAVKERIGFYLDSFLSNSEQENLVLAQFLIGQSPVSIKQNTARGAMGI